jgi:hypothetical protein
MSNSHGWFTWMTRIADAIGTTHCLYSPALYQAVEVMRAVLHLP